MKRVVALVATSAVAVGTVLLPALASPARADLSVQLTAGALLPQRTTTGSDGGVTGAAPGFMISSQGPYDTDDPTASGPMIRRLSDNSAVRALSAPGGFSSARLSGGALIRVDGQVVTAEAIESGATLWTITAPADSQVLGATAAGALVSTAGVLHLLRPGGADVTAAPALSPAANALVVADTRTAVFRASDNGLYALDLVTGTVATLTTSIGPYAPAVLAQDRVYWVDGSLGAATELASWVGRDGSPGGSVPVATDYSSARSYTAVGNRLLRRTEGQDPTQQVLVGDYREVDLGTGALSASVATGVLNLVAEGDGGAVLHRLAASGTQVVEMGADLATRVVATLPPQALRASAVVLSGARAFADFGPPFGGGDTWVTPSTGSGAWTSAGPGALSAASGDALVTRTKDNPTTFRITSPGVFYDLVAGDVRLGRGGRLFTSSGEPGVSGIPVKRVSDGVTVDQLLELPPAHAVDADRLWTGPFADGSIRGKVVGGAALPTAQSGLACTPYGVSLTVAGRWAVAGCYTGPELASFQQVVVDLAGEHALYVLPATENVSLANGYLVSAHTVDGGGRVARVLDLTTHEVRDYGPVGPVGLPVADSDEGLRVVYLDGRDQVRTAALDWVTPAPDTVAPVLQSFTTTPTPTTNGTVGVRWSFADGPAPLTERASGVASYELRGRTRALPSGAFGAYASVSPAGTSFELAVPAGVQACFQVRASDAAGRTSAWSAERCVVVDGAAPRITAVSAGPAVVAAVAARNVTFAYAGSDDTGVTSFDVALRSAGPGQALSPYAFPSTWQKRTTRSVVKAVAPGGQACFTVRARDGVGRVSGWSPLRCAAVPLDDTRLTASGAVSRLRSAAALGGTVSRLERPGAQLAVARQVGRRLALVAFAGPGNGVADVFVGGRRVARLNLASGATRRQVFVISGGAGTVVVRDVAGRVAIDGLALLCD